ncbi:hypothetical protein J7E88_32995 [Streptomyces sp. ISL-10]|uniref:hypothetical protein n=1 Tax=Streptomyces sp. ISL-10 TaxID=2819172 RepID=UPI001BE892D9|nr:hypothetical protein [Streptomyces sp. ISL-10]MBT2369956.1 hypothetical protein [Streptomyces sp. ISL-10]
MNASVRRVAAGIADAVIEGSSMAVTLLGGILGTYVSYSYSPDSWPIDHRLAIAGAVAVISAVSLYSLTELILAPLRGLTVKTCTTTDHGPRPPPPPLTP